MGYGSRESLSRAEEEVHQLLSRRYYDELASRSFRPEAETTATKPRKEKVRYEQYADAFLMDMATDEGLRLCFHGGRFLRYDGRRYVPGASSVQHRAAIIPCSKRKIPQNNAVVGNVVPIIETRTLVRLDQHPELPFWLTTEPPCESRNVVAFGNGLIDIEEAMIRGEAVRAAAHAQVGQPPMSPS